MGTLTVDQQRVLASLDARTPTQGGPLIAPELSGTPASVFTADQQRVLAQLDGGVSVSGAQEAVGGGADTDMRDPGLGANAFRAGLRDIISLSTMPTDSALFGIEQGLKLNRAALDMVGIESPFLLDEGISLANRADLSETVTEGFRRAGLRTDPQFDEDTPTYEKLITNITGPVVAGGGAIGVLGKLANSGKLTGMVANALKTRFGTIAKADAAAGTAGGTARTATEGGQNPFGSDDLTATVSEIVASMFFGSMTERALRAREAVDAFKGFSFKGKVDETIDKFATGQRNQAGALLRGALEEGGEDIPEVVSRLRAPGSVPEQELAEIATTGRATTNIGMKTESPTLTSLVNSIVTADPVARRMFLESKEYIMDFVKGAFRRSLGGGENVPEDFVDAMVKASDFSIKAVELRLRQLVDESVEKIRLLPTNRAEDYQTIVKEVLEEAMDAARAIEKEAWAAIGVTKIDMTRVVDELDIIMEQSTVAERQTGIVPSAGVRATIRELAEPTVIPGNKGAIEGATPGKKLVDEPDIIEGGAQEVSTDEILSLKHVILEEAAIAKVNGAKILHRKLVKLAESVQDVLNNAGTANTEAITEAQKISRGFNDRFSRDVIAPLLASTQRRGKNVAGPETMERLWRSGGAGRTNIRALMLASGKESDGKLIPQLPEAARSYILQQFSNSAVVNGVIDPVAGRQFADTFAPLLDEAGMSKQIEDLVDMGVRTEAGMLAKKMAVDDSTKNVLATILRNYGATGDGLVAKVVTMFRSPAGRAADTLNEMFTRLENSPGLSPGEKTAALQGLKATIAEGAIGSLYKGGTTEAVQDIPGLINRIQNTLVSTGRYTDEEIARIGAVGEVVAKQFRAARQQALHGQSITAEKLSQVKVIENLTRFMAVRFAAPVIKGSGPGALSIAQQVSSIGASLGRKLTIQDAQELVVMSMFDPQLAADLLEETGSMSPGARSRIVAWLKIIANTIGTGVGFITPKPQATQGAVVNRPEEQRGF